MDNIMQPLYIYIVEDDLLMASALKRLLTGMGHCVCGIADSYIKAVYEIQRIEVDLVITDIMLTGEKTGIDLGRYIKANLNIPFIYLSSISSNDMIRAALDNLPDSFLFKPVNKASLSAALMNFNTRNNIPAQKNLSVFCPR